MIADDNDFVASMRRTAEDHSGPEDVRVPVNVLLRLIEIAEKAQTERLERFVR